MTAQAGVRNILDRYDAIIIGTGQAGPSLAARLAASGMRIAIVERGRFGGTCVNTGCTPTKTLVASAYAARMVQRASEYGVNIAGSVQVDMSRVKARKDAVVAQSRISLESWLTSVANVSVYRGHARFVGPRTVSVGSDTLTGERIFIDVGGAPACPTSQASTRCPT
jgi:pyruvate/2-oxoglutarate dehydrogenase complex dihydrolipoamide dehydrogenase (E3) component